MSFSSRYYKTKNISDKIINESHQWLELGNENTDVQQLLPIIRCSRKVFRHTSQSLNKEKIICKIITENKTADNHSSTGEWNFEFFITKKNPNIFNWKYRKNYS